jgi:acyl-CoA dehydrogenase
MDFSLTEDQRMMANTATQISAKYGPEYWREKDEQGAYPKEFLEEIGNQGFFGLPVPEEYGGLGMGLTELAIAMEALCSGGGGGGPALGYLFGLLGNLSIRHHGNEDQKTKYLPDMAAGRKICAFALSEPDAGTNSLNIKTFARKEGSKYIINGGKWFITNIENSDVLLLVARTTKPDESESRAGGISLFLVDLPQTAISYSPIPKHGFNYYKSNQVFIDDLEVDESCLLGQEGRGFYALLETLNPERILVAAGVIGTARLALSYAVEYAKDRNVFNAPIGSHQAVQHPLAAAHAKLESAWLSVLHAATLNDKAPTGKEAGNAANMAKYVAVEAAFEAGYHAMQTFGGSGYAKEFHQERWWREIQLFRLAPLTQQMTLNYIGEHVLGLPKSY